MIIGNINIVHNLEATQFIKLTIYAKIKFMLRNSLSLITKVNFYTFYALLGYYVFSSLIFPTFMKPNGCFTFKIGFHCSWFCCL